MGVVRVVRQVEERQRNSYRSAQEEMMLDLLHEAEKELPQLLASPDGWKSLLVDYHPPHVERVYREWRGMRLCLHWIHPCERGEALFHPHPWPSAMRVLSGTYEMGVGYGEGDHAPPVAALIVASGPMEYEMTDRDAWHYVRPLGGVAMTLMVSGAPWQRSFPQAPTRLSPLSDARVKETLEAYRRVYSQP
jgi:hypothetical protein